MTLHFIITLSIDLKPSFHGLHHIEKYQNFITSRNFFVLNMTSFEHSKKLLKYIKCTCACLMSYYSHEESVPAECLAV